jgi:predicted Zn-dependent peptidase
MHLSDLGIHRSQARSKSGIPVITFERVGTPISLRLAFKAGSRFDPVGKEGLAHFAEHMLVSGTKNRPTRDAIARYAESFGAYKNAATGIEMMEIVVDFGDPADLKDMLELLREFLEESIFNPETFEKERGVIQSERATHAANPARRVGELWQLLFFQETAVGRSVIGSEDSINAISLDDITHYVQNQLTQTSAVLVTSGGSTAAKIAEAISDWQLPVGRIDNEPPTLPHSRQRTVMMEPTSHTDQVHLIWGWRSCGMDEADRIALDMLASIVGSGGSSWMYQRLRQERGLVYSASAGQTSLSDAGTWTMRTACADSHIPEVMDVLRSIVTDIKAGAITEEELEHVKQRMIKGLRLATQTSSFWADYHLDTVLLAKNREATLLDEIAALETIKRNDLVRVADTYLRDDAWYLAAAGSTVALEKHVDAPSSSI